MAGLNILTYYKPKRLNWWDSITNEITLGALPLKKNQLKEIIDQENKAVLSVVEKHELKGIGVFSDPVTEEDWIEAKVEQKILSVMDTDAPSIEQIQEGVKFMRSHIELGQKVYVHCKAGKGRSPLIVICYLMCHENMDYANAFKFVKNKRWIQLNTKQVTAAKTYEKGETPI
jgi:atypical dual specificity phosphatase